jgi:hypothetical protein
MCESPISFVGVVWNDPIEIKLKCEYGCFLVGSLRVDQRVPETEANIEDVWDVKGWVEKGGAWRPTKCQAVSKVCEEIANNHVNIIIYNTLCQTLYNPTTVQNRRPYRDTPAHKKITKYLHTIWSKYKQNSQINI